MEIATGAVSFRCRTVFGTRRASGFQLKWQGADRQSRDPTTRGHNPRSRFSRFAMFALLLGCVLLISANVYQYFDHQANNRARLEATLTRPAQSQVGSFQGPALSVTSFEHQTRHQNALTTE